MADEDIKKQLELLLSEMDKIRERTDKAARAAEFASKGFLELNQEFRHVKINSEDFNTRMTVLENKVDTYIMMINKRFEAFQENIKEDFKDLGSKVDSNLKWNVGITITLLSIFLALIKLL